MLLLIYIIRFSPALLICHCRTTIASPLGTMWVQLEILCLEVVMLVCQSGLVTRV